MTIKALTIVMLCSALTVSACGRSAKNTTTVNTSTTGQELTDLKAALDAGALTPEEYEDKREEILKKKL